MGSPARRLLLEWAPLSYLFGNTPAVDLFSGRPPTGDSKVLLLGCGDVRNTLRTITNFPTCHALELHLNDTSDLLLARAVLLLSIVQRINPGSASDIAYLWDVTYNLHWGKGSGTAARFAEDVSRLLANDLGCCSIAEVEGEDSNLAALRGVWAYWLRALEMLDVQEVQEKRSKHTTLWWSNHQSAAAAAQKSSSSFNLESWVDNRSVSQSYSVLHPGSDLPETHDEAKLREQFCAEYNAWYRSGTIRSQFAQTETLLSKLSINQPEATSPAAVARPSPSGAGWVNPTLLQPHTGRYDLHYDADPFEPFLPLPDSVVRASIAALKWNGFAGKGSSRGKSSNGSRPSSSSSGPVSSGASEAAAETGNLLTHICMTLMGHAAAAAQARLLVVSETAAGASAALSVSKKSKKKSSAVPQIGTSASSPAPGNNITVILHRGDALALCLGGKSSTLAADAVFDIIHTSNLADHLSLANTLLATRPRLNPALPGSCILTQSMTWPSIATTQRGYLRTALCAEPELFPTLFGLRLTTDLDSGRPTAPKLGQILCIAKVSDPRTLAWIRADRPAVPHAPRLGLDDGKGDVVDALTPALLSLVQLCCCSVFTGQPWEKERIALRALSPWTLGLLLAQAGGRWAWGGPSGPLGSPLPVPDHCSLAFRASLLHYCPALAATNAAAAAMLASAASSTARENGIAGMQAPTCDASLQALLATYPVQCSGQVVLDIASPSVHYSSQPALRLVVFSIAELMSSTRGRKCEMMQQIRDHPHPKPFSICGMDAPLQKELQKQKPPAGMHFFDCITATPHKSRLDAAAAKAAVARGRVYQNQQVSCSERNGSSFQKVTADRATCEVEIETAKDTQLQFLHLMKNFGASMKNDSIESHAVMDVGFQLPSDHGLDVNGLFVVLMDCGQVPPVPLSLATPLQYFDFSSAAPHTNLCSALANTTTAFTTHTTENPPPAMLNESDNTSSATPSRKKSNKSSSKESQGLRHASMQVTSLHESATAFTASIAITLPPDASSASGLSVTSDSSAPKPPATLANGAFHPHDPANPAAECAHEVRVSIARPVPVSLTLNLPWPVAAGSVNAKLSKSTGTISLVLPKATEWPQDWSVPGVVQQVCCSQLPDWGPVPERGGGIAAQMSAQWTHEELVQVARGLRGLSQTTNPAQELKETIKIIFIRWIQDNVDVHLVRDKGNPSASAEIFIRVHPPIRRMEDGRPALALSVLDHRVAEHLQSTGAMDTQTALTDFHRIIFKSGAKERAQQHSILCDQDELKLLRSMLRRNALHCQPTEWQLANLPTPGPNCPWVSTFIFPVFPEAVGDLTSNGSVASMSDLLAHDARVEPKASTLKKQAAAAGQASNGGSLGTSQASSNVQVPSTGSGGAVVCAACDRPPSVGVPLLRCGRCRGVWYCCTDCQKNHWKVHKGVCSK